ncbi:AraC family transcriptional regulator [Clostridium sp. AM58-1XD]|uniref:AraC family transcriptional regulator n=1 Tax=Clostridium sp. AM58-1XD TaxID=2292307 RepID=UPI000E4F0B2E|nr:AraC family transcriptional regulator [Clostridium sp. AM58-1XD]RGY95854.1 AraC family transcriptional regulator [Clostridium sp. AM58-1XD]
MDNNIKIVEQVVEYIEDHLEDQLDLERLAGQAGYSKYHLHRMFLNIVGFPVHRYVQRRRLTEAARQLVYSDKPILEIALCAGYETQRSFHVGFKSLFKCSPRAFRKKKDFYPVQLKFCADGNKQLRGDMILDVKTVDSDKIMLAGYTFHTRFGFYGIGRCWKKLHSNKRLIYGRTDMDYLTGLNDYSSWISDTGSQPAFDYYAAAEVSSFLGIPKGMVTKELPAGRYVVFQFRGCSQDSLQPVADYIYKVWFPQSTCRLNESAKYDFAKYGEQVDSDGKSLIEYWIPIL